MGIIACRARLMLEARKNGVNFTSTLTLGRQSLNMAPKEIYKLSREFGVGDCNHLSNLLKYKDKTYADEFFYSFLGVRKLSVIDHSDYQGADITHDLNLPISHELDNRFDVVIDGGTLEHIFNFPEAIKNCMRMVKRGGTLFVFSMSNNHCGHGFYQFSPELFFRIFQYKYGYKCEKVIMLKHPFPGAELSSSQKCYLVKDPALLGRRANIVSRSPLGIMIQASKTDNVEIFKSYPQQSDYIASWDTGSIDGKSNGFSHNKTYIYVVSLYIWKLLPLKMRRIVAGFYQLYRSSLTRDKSAFSRWY